MQPFPVRDSPADRPTDRAAVTTDPTGVGKACEAFGSVPARALLLMVDNPAGPIRSIQTKHTQKIELEEGEGKGGEERWTEERRREERRGEKRSDEERRGGERWAEMRRGEEMRGEGRRRAEEGRGKGRRASG